MTFEELVRLRAEVTQEILGRTSTRMSMTLGELREDAADLDDNLEVVVNVQVEMPGEGFSGLVPLVLGLTGAFGDDDLDRFTLIAESRSPHEGHLIWVNNVG